jgi:hypothetical protein
MVALFEFAAEFFDVLYPEISMKELLEESGGDDGFFERYSERLSEQQQQSGEDILAEFDKVCYIFLYYTQKEIREVYTDEAWEALLYLMKKHQMKFGYRGDGGKKLIYRFSDVNYRKDNFISKILSISSVDKQLDEHDAEVTGQGSYSSDDDQG